MFFFFCFFQFRSKAERLLNVNTTSLAKQCESQFGHICAFEGANLLDVLAHVEEVVHFIATSRRLLFASHLCLSVF